MFNKSILSEAVTTAEIEESKAETLKHADAVLKTVQFVTEQLIERGSNHDASKLESPEVEIFAQYGPKLKGLDYGSSEYDRCRQKMSKALEHHYQINRHHPEHYPDRKIVCCDDCGTVTRLDQCPKCGGDKISVHFTLKGMTLVDLVEMFCDWYAACKRHNTGDIEKSVEINIKRFAVSEDLAEIFRNTAKLFKANNL
jgi:hypothetical protein